MLKTTIILLVLSLFLAGFLSFYHYLYNAKSKSKVNLLLAFLRFVSFSLVFVLLINPIVTRKILEINKPPLPIFIDKSSSIKELQATEKAIEIYRFLQKNTALKEKFEVQTFLFDANVYNANELLFDGKQTNTAAVANHIKQLYKAPLVPAILVTDGNQTQGNDFVFAFAPNTQVFPVVLGDTLAVEDLKINAINVNKYAFLKNQFPAELFLQYQGDKFIDATVTIFEKEKAIFKENVSFSAKQSSKTITALLEANKVGFHTYKVVVTSKLKEKNRFNNQKYFAIEVLDQQKEIAIISSINHPDLGVLKRSIATNEQRNVSIKKPKEIADVSKYDVCVFYQPTADCATLLQQAKNSNTNCFFITGKSTDYELMNKTQNDLTFAMTKTSEDYLASYQEDFNFFAQENIGFENFPPLQGAFGTIKINSNVAILLASKINGIATQKPLLCFAEENTTRTAFLLGEDIWKWRMESCLETKSFDDFDAFLDKTIQFLVTNSSKKSLLVTHENFYNSGEEIVISAQFYNKNYILDENAALTITLQNKTTKATKKYNFLKGDKEFKVNLDNLESGVYSFSVTEKNSNSSYTNSFEILDFEMEKQFVNANKNRLEQLAKNTDGKVYYPNQLENLVNDLLKNENYKAIQKEITKKQPLIDWYWLLVLLLFTLAAEWFIRKYNGLL